MSETLNFVVIGAQKAGSTFVMQCLQDHPGIYMPSGETPFFQDPDYAPDRMHLLEGVVSQAAPGQLRGIKRPNYLGQSEVPARIAKHLPNVKIIAVLRDPVARAISAYFHYLRACHIPLVPINQGLRDILDGKWVKQYPLSSTILTYGLYDKHLAHFADYFDEAQTRIVVLDDVSRDPEGVIQSLYGFLGVDDQVVPPRTDDRPMSAIYSMARLRLHRMIQPLVFRTTADYTRIYPRRGTRGLRFLFNHFDRTALSKIFPASKPAIDDDVMQALRLYYKEDVQRLRERLDHPLDGW